jgi:Tfp pilus assembly PilM family ATPase
MQEGIQRLLLVGGGAGIPGLAEVLSESLQMEVRRAAPTDLMASGDGSLTRADNPAATVAVGLSLFSEASV